MNITLDKFIDKVRLLSEEEEEEENTDLLYLIPGSNNLNVSYGFLKNGIPYVIRLAELSTLVSNNLWELKISKLKYSKDLKEYKFDQAAMDKQSLNDYIRVIEYLFSKISMGVKLKIKGLLFNFPSTTKTDAISYLQKKTFNIIRHSLSSLKSHKIPSNSSEYKWLFLFKDMGGLDKVFSNFSSDMTPDEIENFDIENAVRDIFINPKLYVPAKSIRFNKDFSHFPEIHPTKEQTNLESDSSEDISDELLDKIVENKNELHQLTAKKGSNFLDKNTLLPKINYLAHKDIIERGLELDDDISKERKKNILETKDYYDAVLHILNTPIHPDFFNYFLKEIRILGDKPNDFWVNELYDKIDNHAVYVFLRECSNIVSIFDKNKNRNIATECFLDENDSDDVIKDKIQKQINEPIIVKDFNWIFRNLPNMLQGDGKVDTHTVFDKTINYSLHMMTFFDKLNTFEAKNQIDNIKEIGSIKVLFDNICIQFDKDPKRGFKIICDNLYDTHDKKLRSVFPSFYDWIINYIKIEENKTYDVQHDLFFKKIVYTFDYDLKNDYMTNSDEKSLSQFTFNRLLEKMKSTYKLKAEDIFTKEMVENFHVPTELLSSYNITESTVDSFKKWLLHWLDNNEMVIEDSPFINSIRDQIDNPKSKQRLLLLHQKNTFIKDSLTSSKPVIDSIDKQEIEKIEEGYKDENKPFEESFDLNEQDKNFKKYYYNFVWKNQERKEAIQSYTSDPSTNDVFRKNSKYNRNLAQEQIEVFLDKTVPRTKHNMITVRGSKHDKWMKNNIVGDVVIEPGFLSTTIDVDTAIEFAGDEGMLYLFYIPAGSVGLYVEDITTINDEFEFILSPGSVFKIISIENRFNTHKEKLKGKKGLIYSLLLVNSITHSIYKKIFFE